MTKTHLIKLIAFLLAVQAASATAAVGPPTTVSPGDLSSPGPIVSTLTPTFTWNAVSGATGYGLYIRDMTASGTPLIYPNASGTTTTPLTGTSFVLPSGYLVSGHNYKWNMSSFVGSTESTTFSTPRYFQDAVQQLPDLVISSISANPTSGKPGDSISVTVTVKNNGPGSAATSTTRIRLALSTTITTSDPLLDTFTASALSSGQSLTYTRTVVIPSGQSAGSYYMGATANADAALTENNGYNNQNTTPFTVQAQLGEPASLGVLWLASPNFNDRPAGQQIDTIIIHTVEGTYANGKIILTDDTVPLANRVSAHYIISPQGEITQLVDLSKRAWHATYYNDRAIGIEMAGYANDPSTWNTQNLEAIENLVAYLVGKYNIRIVHSTSDASTYPNCLFTEAGLLSHSQIQPGCNGYTAKFDPGPYFPWGTFLQDVQTKVASDATPPTITTFNVSPPSTVTLGQGFTISYTVSDSGGSGLKQVELWRANDISGVPSWPNDPCKINSLSGSGNGPVSSPPFSDSPSTTGTYWYGVHVVDNAGNWNDEQNSKTGGVPGDFGPIMVTVTPPSYTITVSASPSGGGTVSGGGTFAAGSSRTVTATANSGYTFANWTENGSVVSSSASYNFTLNGNRNLVANFTANPVNYTLSLSKTGNGSVRVNGTLRSLPWSGSFTAGTNVTLEAAADSSWQFSNWSGDISGSSNPTSIQMNGIKSVTANYIIALSPSQQPQLKAPWRGIARITQGNNSGYSHNVCYLRSFDREDCSWESTYAIDVGLTYGSDVLAPADGDVCFCKTLSGTAGKTLAIRHIGPTGKAIYSVFLHLSAFVVKSGAAKQGQVVAKSGDLGGTAAHLHFHIVGECGERPDLSTIPIERLFMKQSGKEFREYDARKGDLDDTNIGGQSFESDNGKSSLTITSHSPVNLIVTDPDGLVVSKQLNEVPGSTYLEYDPNEDGDLDDMVYIPNKKIGDYLVEVLPEPNASPTDTYSLEMTTGTGQTMILAQDVPIYDIPAQPYEFESKLSTVDFDASSNVTLKDCNNNDVTFTLSGAGYGQIDCCDCNFSNITLYNTTEKSGFTIKTRGKTETSVGDIIVNGSLKGITAKTTDLRGDITVNGSLGSLTFDDIADGHAITIGPSANPKAGTLMKFDQVRNLTINSQMPIKTLSATEWLGGSINAPSVGSITTKGNKKRGIPGDFYVNVTLDGSINSAKVAGTLSGEWACNSVKSISTMDVVEANLILSQPPDTKVKILALGTLTAKGWIDSSRIISTGHIGTVTAGAIADSSCFAGVTGISDLDADGVLDLPDPAVYIDYIEPATIKKITIKGIKGEQYCVINSNIAAAQVLSAYLAYPKNDNAGVAFGVSAGFIKALKVKDAEGTQSWKNLDKPSDSKEFVDAEIRLY